MALVMAVVSFLTFFIFFIIPGGDPAVRLAGRYATDQQVAAVEREWGFDKPFWVQYGNMMENVFTGELISFTRQEDVVDRIIDGAPRTFALAIGAAIIWMVLGVSLGLFSAMRAGAFSDRLLTVLALIGISMPVFWLGALASYYLGYKAQIFPDGGYVTIA